jgi:hypothetical protein
MRRLVFSLCLALGLAFAACSDDSEPANEAGPDVVLQDSSLAEVMMESSVPEAALADSSVEASAPVDSALFE